MIRKLKKIPKKSKKVKRSLNKDLVDFRKPQLQVLENSKKMMSESLSKFVKCLSKIKN